MWDEFFNPSGLGGLQTRPTLLANGAMTTQTQTHAAKEIVILPRPAARWWLVPIAALAVLLFLAVLTAVAIAFRLRQQHQAAAAAVRAEVRRIQSAGEPITTEEMYAYHRVPPGTVDITEAWMAALYSGFREEQFYADATSLPIVGEGDKERLRPGAPSSRLAAAELFLQKYDATLKAALAAARLEGECRFPLKFEKGIGALLPHAQRMRAVVTLLELNVRVRALRGDTAAALESLEGMFAGSEAMAHQPSLIEHLVRAATLNMALEETDWLLNETQLTDEQLARLQARLSAVDLHSGLSEGLIGVRSMGYHLFHHPEIMADAQLTGTKMPLAWGASGRLSRPADCLLYLELLGESIAASSEPFPEAHQRVGQVENRLKAVVGSRNPLEKMQYIVTSAMLPGLATSFDATARGLARRDALLAAIAAERHRLKTGSFPAKLADLVPGFLPAIPTDSFDGQPLRMIASEGEIVIYSVGDDGQDDGGVENSAASTPDASGHIPGPDIIVRVRTTKGPPPPAP